MKRNNEAAIQAAFRESSPSTDHDAAMIEELKADPDYVEVYLQMALDDTYEAGGVAASLTALRCVLPVRQ